MTGTSTLPTLGSEMTQKVRFDRIEPVLFRSQPTPEFAGGVTSTVAFFRVPYLMVDGDTSWIVTLMVGSSVL